VLKISTASTDPPIHYFWSQDYNATVEVTQLQSLSLVRASKAYRLSSQSEDGRENWTRNLSKVNDYLKDRGLRFRISIDYVPEVSPTVSVDRTEVQKLASQAVELEDRINQLNNKQQRLERKQRRGLDALKDRVQKQIGGVKTQINRKEDELQQVMSALENKRQRQNQWKGNGVMSTYLFEVSTDTELAATQNIEHTIDTHLEDVKATHGNPVRQALEGSNFKLKIEEVTQPRILHQLEHIGLANPAVIDQTISEAPDPVTDRLKTVQKQVAEQFRATALKDLETENGVFQRNKSTPARGIASILTDLEERQLLTDKRTKPPQSGPGIGATPAADQTAGFDPAEHGPHYYIAGSSGTGKTHLKRVFMENVASLGYNLINIDPSSYQGIGLSLPNTELEAANPTGIQATHYSTSNKLKEVPSDFNEIFNGISTLSFKDEPASETAAVTASILDQISSHDFADNPLFVFIEEADNFTDTVAIDPLRTLVQEGRKFGVHVVLVSQRPKAFDYTEKDIRQETSYILMNRRYSQNGLGRLFDIDPTNLERGQAVFVDFVDIPEIVVDTRDTLTRLWSGTPTEKEIQQVQETRGDLSTDSRFPDLEDRPTQETGGDRSPGGTTNELDSEEREVVHAIQSYIDREEQLPSQNKVIKESSFGAGKTLDILDELIDRGVVTTQAEMRYGNEATVHEIA